MPTIGQMQIYILFRFLLPISFCIFTILGKPDKKTSYVHTFLSSVKIDGLVGKVYLVKK